MAVDVSQGIFIESLKKFMFACQPGDHSLGCRHEADVEMAEESKEKAPKAKKT